VLRLQVTSETDAFFLHTLELCEDDFAALKARSWVLGRARGAAWSACSRRSWCLRKLTARAPRPLPPAGGAPTPVSPHARLPALPDVSPAPTAQAEQSILVDFGTFPTKLVELFALCTAAAAAAGSPRHVPRVAGDSRLLPQRGVAAQCH
jgi:hypothetical protein